mmetsp:Transcript_8269/g.22046  ORF Transcript_8269/g.22046 Transcript_8269/m.22046 type:complete len:261 (+) Transcript_8269:679-1461(+)
MSTPLALADRCCISQHALSQARIPSWASSSLRNTASPSSRSSSSRTTRIWTSATNMLRSCSTVMQLPQSRSNTSNRSATFLYLSSSGLASTSAVTSSPMWTLPRCRVSARSKMRNMNAVSYSCSPAASSARHPSRGWAPTRPSMTCAYCARAMLRSPTSDFVTRAISRQSSRMNPTVSFCCRRWALPLAVFWSACDRHLRKTWMCLSMRACLEAEALMTLRSFRMVLSMSWCFSSSSESLPSPWETRSKMWRALRSSIGM